MRKQKTMHIRLAATLRLILFILPIPLVSCVALANNSPAADDSIVMDNDGYAEIYATRNLRNFDKDKSGSIEETEAGSAWRRLKRLDSDQDGAVSLAELKKEKIRYLKTGGQTKLNIRYKKTADEDLFLDVYYPTGKQVKNCPVVFYTHGGGWAAGSKQSA